MGKESVMSPRERSLSNGRQTNFFLGSEGSSVRGLLSAIADAIESSDNTGFCRIEYCIEKKGAGKTDHGTRGQKQVVRVEIDLGQGVIRTNCSMVSATSGHSLHRKPRSFRRTGTYTIDGKGRVSLPINSGHFLRVDEVVLTLGPLNSLLAMTPSFWSRWFEAKNSDSNFLRDYDLLRQDGRRLTQSTGRVQVGRVLREHCGINRGEEVAIFSLGGCRDLAVILPELLVRRLAETGEFAFIGSKLTYDLDWMEENK